MSGFFFSFVYSVFARLSASALDGVNVECSNVIACIVCLFVRLCEWRLQFTSTRCTETNIFAYALLDVVSSERHATNQTKRKITERWWDTTKCGRPETIIIRVHVCLVRMTSENLFPPRIMSHAAKLASHPCPIVARATTLASEPNPQNDTNALEYTSVLYNVTTYTTYR